MLGRRLAPGGTAVISMAALKCPFVSVTLIARLCVAETAYSPTPRHGPPVGQEIEEMAVKVLEMAPRGVAIPDAWCHVPRDSITPMAENRVADTL